MKKYISVIILILSLLSFSTAGAITISTAIPGSTTISTSSAPGAFIANFYQFALLIGGILAFGIIVYGGIRYMTSAGNPSGQSDAKEWIEAALLGLLLLAGAYFILGVVNPQLRNLNLPGLQVANIPSAVVTSTTGQQISSITQQCLASCTNASCTAACNNANTTLQSAFSGTCTSGSCSSGQVCSNDTSGGHYCTNITSVSTVLPSNTPPAGDYTSCAQANCPTGHRCILDGGNSKYFTCSS